ncbi:biotin/lipoyl-binding protein [Inhella sp.]|uniref:biotin/lipoyl-containing protein n=1 Tax=Inhella sp. TaxID=1921806 RepID=UPI0035AE3808
MTSTLLRPEVTHLQQAQWLGSIRMACPPSFPFLTALPIDLGTYTRKVTLPGVLVPEGGVMDISSPQGGTVTEVLVMEGDEVQAGHALIRLRAER